MRQQLFAHIALLAIGVVIATPLFAHAVCTGGEFCNPLRSTLSSVAGFTSAFLRAAVYVLFPVAVLFIVYSGFQFLMAQGNSEKLSSAKSNFFWTILGVALLLGAWALAELIRATVEPILQTAS